MINILTILALIISVINSIIIFIKYNKEKPQVYVRLIKEKGFSSVPRGCGDLAIFNFEIENRGYIETTLKRVNAFAFIKNKPQKLDSPLTEGKKRLGKTDTEKLELMLCVNDREIKKEMDKNNFIKIIFYFEFTHFSRKSKIIYKLLKDEIVCSN